MERALVMPLRRCTRQTAVSFLRATVTLLSGLLKLPSAACPISTIHRRPLRPGRATRTKKVFQDLGIFSPEETEARAEIMYEAYNTTLSIEAQTMIDMTETGILPACVQDLTLFKDSPDLAGDRAKTYGSIKKENDKLKSILANMPSDMVKEAEYLCDVVKPQMDAVRGFVDAAERLMSKGLYPYPTYEAMLYQHHH